MNKSPQATKKEVPQQSLQKRANSAERPAGNNLEVKFETRTKMPIEEQKNDKEEGGIFNAVSKMFFN